MVFLCVLPQPWLQPWANRATLPPHLPVFKTVTSINKATGRAAAHHSKLSEPLLTLAEKLLVLTACPSQAKPCYQQSSKRSWEEPQAKSHRFPLFSPKFSSFFSTNTSQIVVCLWCISRVLKSLIFWVNSVLLYSCFSGERIWQSLLLQSQLEAALHPCFILKLTHTHIGRLSQKTARDGEGDCGEGSWSYPFICLCTLQIAPCNLKHIVSWWFQFISHFLKENGNFLC